MKFFTKKGTLQKIIIALIIIIVVNFSVPVSSDAADWAAIGGSLLKELMQLLASLGDIVEGSFNHFVVGADAVGSAMIEQQDHNLTNPESWIYWDGKGEADYTVKIQLDKNGSTGGGEWQVPNMLASPENIFANKIGAFDANFIHPNTYSSVLTGETVTEGDDDRQVSSASILQETVSTWYKSFRNIAIVVLLSVLVYMGIRILISSTAPDKAKYKEMLRDWLVALCLIFVIHFIMSGVLTLTEQFNNLFATSVTNIKVTVPAQTEGLINSNEDLHFNTNLMGLARFLVQAYEPSDAAAYTIIYIALVIFTGMFIFKYFKRLLYIAFFTMIAPLVAITYPIDRAGDGKAQAFNMWFKEYTVNVVIQPIHLLLYTMLVGSAIDLAVNNPIYALVAIGFLLPAEKFIKKMFGVEAQSDGGLGSFAGGALVMSGIQKLGGLAGKSAKGGKSGGSSGSEKENNSKIFMGNNSGKLGSYQNGTSTATLNQGSGRI